MTQFLSYADTVLCWSRSKIHRYKAAPPVYNWNFFIIQIEERNINVICGIFHLKGQCHEIFCFRFFSWITFPQAPKNNIRVISNFSENSRRYSQVKMHHRCQWHRWQIAAGINDNGGKVSRTPAANFATSSACVVYILIILLLQSMQAIRFCIQKHLDLP